MMVAEKFNYCVGHIHEGRIGTYSYGVDVFYGYLGDALEFLDYVKKQSPDKDWKIFKVAEVNALP